MECRPAHTAAPASPAPAPTRARRPSPCALGTILLLTGALVLPSAVAAQQPGEGNCLADVL